jgi:hypothetical protein
MPQFLLLITVYPGKKRLFAVSAFINVAIFQHKACETEDCHPVGFSKNYQFKMANCKIQL